MVFHFVFVQRLGVGNNNTTLLGSYQFMLLCFSSITDAIYFFRLVPSVGPDFKQIQVHQGLAEQCQGVEQSPSR